jgi:2-alkenal reductase
VVAIKTVTAQGGGLGSGFIFDNAGHVVTNYHVVEGATELEVDFPSGFKVMGNVVGTDLDSDIAVIKWTCRPGAARSRWAIRIIAGPVRGGHRQSFRP